MTGQGNNYFAWMLLLGLLDGVLVLLVFAGAAVATCPADTAYTAYLLSHSAYLLLFLLLWGPVASRNRLFISRRRDPLGQILLDVAKAVAITVTVSTFLASFASGHSLPRLFLAWFCGGAFVAVAGSRAVLHVTLSSLHARGVDLRQVLIIGANPRVKELLRVIAAHPNYGYNVIGVLEDDPARCRMLEDFNIPWLGKFDSLEQLLTRQVVDEVYIGLPVSSRYETIQNLAHLCEGVGVGVRMIADLFPLRLATSRFHKLDTIPILALSTVPENHAQLLLQRVTDVVVAGLALLALSPLLLLTALAIKIDSRGPVFFFQERVGQNQRRFHMIKFRSMAPDAEARRRDVERLNESEGPVFKARNDPRLTRVGRFIRKYSIDELPQLINVLKGEMSLVGPRPPLPHEVAQYSWNQRRRLSVKPGMTGLSQVRGRSDLSFRQTVDLDLTYIDRWSLWLVLRILLLTIPAVLRGRGAV